MNLFHIYEGPLAVIEHTIKFIFTQKEDIQLFQLNHIIYAFATNKSIIPGFRMGEMVDVNTNHDVGFIVTSATKHLTLMVYYDKPTKLYFYIDTFDAEKELLKMIAKNTNDRIELVELSISDLMELNQNINVAVVKDEEHALNIIEKLKAVDDAFMYKELAVF